MGTTLLPDSDNQEKVYNSDKEIADLERLYHSDSAETSGSDIARQKEVDALNTMYNMPDAQEPTAKPPTSDTSSDDTNPSMKYTGSGEKDAGKKRGIGGRVRNAFSASNPDRLRNAAFAGGFGAALIGVIVGIMFFIGSLPGFHLVNASRLLLASFAISAHQASDTYARITTPNGVDKSKTRLTIDQKILSKKIPAILDKAGIGFTYDSKTGRAVSAHLDPSKQNGLGNNEAEIKKNLAQRFGVSESDITVRPASIGGKIDINMKGKGVIVQENIIRDFANRTDRGKVMTLLISRHFRQYLNVPSLFHPFERAKAAAQNKFSGLASSLRDKALENERIKSFKESMDAKRLKIKGFLDANSFKIGISRLSASAVLAMCAVRDVATAIEEQNHSAYVEPSQQSALDQIAKGDQVAYGSQDDFTSDQVNSAVAHMYGDYYGQTYSILDSDSMRARQGLPPLKINDSTAAAHYAQDKATINNAFANTSPWQSAYDMTSAMNGGVICRPAIQAALTLGDLALTIGAAAISGGIGAAAKEAVTVAGVAAVTSVVIGYMESASTNPFPDVTPGQGLLGGDFMSQGADSVANVVSANSGGAVVSQSRADQLRSDAQSVDLSIAKDQNIAEKLSPTNIYSPIAKIVNGINASSAQNLRNAASSFANIFLSVIRLPFTFLSSHAHAQSTGTTSTTNTIALTAAVEKLIKTKDPNTIVSGAGSVMRTDGYGGTYAARANVCFGATFLDSNDSETGDTYFDIQINKTVDPDAPLYKEQNCADEGDGKWVTISAAVHIITVADAAACRDAGDDEACTRTGAGTTTASSSSSADTTDAIGKPNTSTGRAQGSWGGYSNGKISTSAMTKITPSFLGVSSSDTIQICNTKISAPYLNPSAAVSIKALNDAFIQKFGHMMYFQSCYREIGVQSPKSDSTGQWYAYYFYSGATPGTSNHGWGLAVDIGPNPKKDQGCDPGSSKLTASEKEMCQWITDNAPNYGWKNGKDVVPSEQWHFEYSRKLPTGAST